jgi:hypothetical protein
MITLTTTVPCSLRLTEIVVGSPNDFNPAQSTVADAVEPLATFAGQVYDYDSPADAGDTPDVTFGLYAANFSADPAGSTTHTIQVDPAVTNIKYEASTTRVRSTSVPAAVPPNEAVYIWCSDSPRFPD